MPLIDPYKIIGLPSSWQTYDPDCEQDVLADAERLAMVDHFLTRLRHHEELGTGEPDTLGTVLGGAMCGTAGLFIGAQGGPDRLADDAFDHWIALATFAWHHSIGIYDQGAGNA